MIPECKMQKLGILKSQKYPFHSKTKVSRINVTFYHCFFHYILQHCNTIKCLRWNATPFFNIILFFKDGYMFFIFLYDVLYFLWENEKPAISSMAPLVFLKAQFNLNFVSSHEKSLPRISVHLYTPIFLYSKMPKKKRPKRHEITCTKIFFYINPI